MVAVKKILVAVDFDQVAGRALDFARVLADACGASIHVLHVIGYPLADSETLSNERREVCSRLEALLNRTDRDRRHATFSCEAGTPVHAIARYAANHAIDLIVMGTHSHAPTFRMATGSIADGVIGSAPCAVLAVKADQAAHERLFDPVAVVTSA